MYLIEPSSGKLKWDIRVRLHDGRLVKIPGDRDKETAIRIGERVDMLIKAKSNGDPPPAFLTPWLANMNHKLLARLIKLGLVPEGQQHRNRALKDWIEPWQQVVQGRKPRSVRHAPQQAHKVRRVLDAVPAVSLADLHADRVVEEINAFVTIGCKNPTPLTTASRRSYGIAMKDFTSWLSGKLKTDDPLKDMAVPGQYENPEYERQPLSVAEFRRLMKYLDTFEYYTGQKARWTAYDRKIIYWTAVKSGYRQTEMKKLRHWNFRLNDKPPTICLKAGDTKNKTKGAVPIPSDLAAALKTYLADRDPDGPAFPFPSTSGSIVDMLRRDLQGAGVAWRHPGGEIVDFHTLRSTAITWWLEKKGLKTAQILARLKSLAPLQFYSRNMRIEDFEWLDKEPKLTDDEKVADEHPQEVQDDGTTEVQDEGDRTD